LPAGYLVIHNKNIVAQLPPYVNIVMNFLSPPEVEQFAAQNYLVLDHWLGSQPLMDAQSEFDELRQRGLFKKAQIRDATAAEMPVRGDSTLWLDEKFPPVLRSIYSYLQDWIPLLNQNFYCGISRLEAHLAHYPPGPGYEKHLDQARGQKDRIISLVLYLNDPWPKDAGGELLIYPAHGQEILTKISPLGGRLVIFRSDIFPHEVRPCQQSRRSLTGWFRSDAL
jgi:SM-20-related protein